jgi:hypothetical protein
VQAVADDLGHSVQSVSQALDFYGEFPDEIDERISVDARAEKRLREIAERRERLVTE